MSNFKSLTGGVAAAALVSALGLAYAQTTTTEPPAGSTPSATQMQNQPSQPPVTDGSTLPGTTQSRDNTTSSTMPSDRSGNTFESNFEREPRADRN